MEESKSAKRVDAERLCELLYAGGYTSRKDIPAEWTDEMIEEWLGNMGYEWLEDEQSFCAEDICF